MKTFVYNFQVLDNCNICNSTTSNFKILGRRLNNSQGFRPSNKLGITTTIVKCKNCGLIFPNPFPIPESLDDHYGISAETYWTPENFLFNEKTYDSLFNSIEKLINKTSEIKSLDIGAGLGKILVSMKKRGYDAYGIEPSKTFYDRAINVMGISKEKLSCISVEDVSYENNTFDLVFLSAVLEHFYNPAMVLKKVHNWLKPGGIVFIEVPNSSWLISKIINLNYSIRGLDYVCNLSPMHEPYHLYEFSKKSFEIFSKKNGFEIARFENYVCETFMPKLISPLLKYIMKNTGTGMDLAIWLRKKD